MHNDKIQEAYEKMLDEGMVKGNVLSKHIGKKLMDIGNLITKEMDKLSKEMKLDKRGNFRVNKDNPKEKVDLYNNLDEVGRILDTAYRTLK